MAPYLRPPKGEESPLVGRGCDNKGLAAALNPVMAGAGDVRPLPLTGEQAEAVDGDVPRNAAAPGPYGIGEGLPMEPNGDMLVLLWGCICIPPPPKLL